MAVELPACFDLLYVADGGFCSSFLPKKEWEDDILQAFFDAEMAEELQYQEAVKASMITCQMPRNLSSSTTPSMSTIEAIPITTTEPSRLHLKESGESSLSYCEICLERKGKDQMMTRHDSTGQTCCLECSKTIELSRNQWCSKEKMISHGNGNGKTVAAGTCNKPSPKAKTDLFSHGKEDIVGFNSAQDDDGPDAEWKKSEIMQQQENLGLPSIADFKMLVGRGNRGHTSTSRNFKKIATGFEAIPIPTTEPSILHLKEKGESSLSNCEICLERKGKDQMMIRHDSTGQTCCLECSKTIELSRNQWCSKEKMISHGNGNGKTFTAGTCNKPSPKAKTDLFSHGKEDIVGFNSAQDGDGPDAEWKKSEIMQQQENSGLPSIADFEMLVGRGNRGHTSTSRNFKKIATGFVDCSQAGRRWNRQSNIVYTTPGKGSAAGQAVSKDIQILVTTASDDCGFDVVVDSDKFDADTIQESHKNCKEEESFFEFSKRLEKLTIEEITDPTRLWQCPACQGGSDAYEGILALLSHANRKGKTLNLHRVLMEKLEEKLFGRRTSDGSAGEGLSKWKGLKDEKNDRQIVWPPMVVIMNTIHNKDENNKWTGMTNQELLDLFSSYDAIEKAQQAYSSYGHCGMSVLIFESSARGYLEAELLDKHFADQGTGRKDWKRCSEHFLASRERQLYGYLALKEEVDLFNLYSKGKLKLKYEIRSYEEMVVNRIRQMNEDNHRLIWWEMHAKLLEESNSRMMEREMHAKLLEESNSRMMERLQKAMKEIDVLKKEIQLKHEEDMEAIDFQEQFYKNQMKIILEERDNRKERDHESPHEEAENVDFW